MTRGAARKAAAFAKELRKRQKGQRNLTLCPPLPPVKTPQQYRDAFGPRPEWCEFQAWGYLMPERDGIDTPTGYYPVIDYVRDNPFPVRQRGQVTA